MGTKNDNEKGGWFDEIIIRLGLPLLAAIALLGALLRMFRGGDGNVLKRVDQDTLLYLGVAGALLLLRNVKTMSFGSYKVELDKVRKAVEEIKTTAENATNLAQNAQNAAVTARNTAENAQNTAENAQSSALGTGKKPGSARGRGAKGTVRMLGIKPDSGPWNLSGETEGEAKGAENIPETDDPYKGKFGRSECRHQRILEGSVTGIPGLSYFNVKLTVRSTSPDNPLKGAVQFFLHPTFQNDTPIMQVGPNGIAELNLKAWGAFTVGAVLDEGKTMLELDLAELAGAPEEFKKR